MMLQYAATSLNLITAIYYCLQCFDTVGWASQKNMRTVKTE